MKKLYILISTYGQRINELHNVLLPRNEDIKYLVSHQAWKNVDVDKSLFERDDVYYFPNDSVGVTKSRNFLIEKAQVADYIYFCDDDIKLNPDIYELIVLAHKKTDSAIVTFNVSKDENVDFNFQTDFKLRNRNRTNILSVGTVQISAKRDLIKNVRFCEYMGAGSEIPIGDEAIFLSDIMTNYTISHADVNICYHPHESSGSCKESKFSYARGMTIRKVFGFYYGSLIVIPFFIFRAKLFRYSPKQFIDYIKGFLKVK